MTKHYRTPEKRSSKVEVGGWRDTSGNWVVACMRYYRRHKKISVSLGIRLHSSNFFALPQIIGSQCEGLWCIIAGAAVWLSETTQARQSHTHPANLTLCRIKWPKPCYSYRKWATCEHTKKLQPLIFFFIHIHIYAEFYLLYAEIYLLQCLHVMSLNQKNASYYTYSGQTYHFVKFWWSSNLYD